MTTMTFEPHEQALLQEIFRRHSRSLLQYVHESYPWTNPERQALLDQLLGLIEEERQGTAALAQFLTRNHLSRPFPGPYPMDFTNVNYVALDYLLPLLRQEQQRAIAWLQEQMVHLKHPEARALVQENLRTKERHLKILEGILSASGGCQPPVLDNQGVKTPRSPAIETGR